MYKKGQENFPRLRHLSRPLKISRIWDKQNTGPGEAGLLTRTCPSPQKLGGILEIIGKDTSSFGKKICSSHTWESEVWPHFHGVIWPQQGVSPVPLGLPLLVSLCLVAQLPPKETKASTTKHQGYPQGVPFIFKIH